ncbi:hypothetical protein F5Y04DRAFT_269105 [Hypomontagnella monticulosa]|nr:hypothetical protein F5Y04DRAFT_269105 [Hypomontagnella monticulosa]
MSQYQNGRGTGQTPGMGGSVRRAREQAEAGMPRGGISPFPDPSIRRVQAPPGLQMRDGQGQIGMAISRPTPLPPQWPLAGPISAPSTNDSEPYRPPPGRSQPPQRPPRPSRVPSILDASRLQEHTPVFQYTPQNARVSELSVPDTIQSTSSRQSSNSSVGSIPDFPMPVAAAPLPASRRSVTLGPPPSSRRGASSFYSTASFVSPIPEESPRTRSHTSYASSAAIPDSFGSLSPGYSPNAASVDDTIAEESVVSDDADESRLVRNASIGKRGKPSLVVTGSSERNDSALRPGPKPIQGGPFREGTGYIEASSSSSGNGSREAVGGALTADNMLNVFESASATDPSSIRKANASPRPFRLSAIRRPPRLDMDAVRAAEARGSLTSLPDLIRRATRLASLMERGRRPASRFDDLDFPEDVYGGDPEKELPYDTRHQSGLSDMLAAFPPPASRNGVRQSRASTSWPLGRRSFLRPPVTTEQAVDSDTESRKKGRRCCGLPIWTCFALVVILVCIVAAAVVVPVKFLVIDKAAEQNAAQPAISDCEAQLRCANGGTNVVLQGVCSCICSNGFTGADCTVPTSQGCTTTSISTADSNINNVTIGQAIPRLIKDAQANFSIPLVATVIQSKFNKENLSCNTENALVTFDGQSLRTQQNALAEVSDLDPDSEVVQAAVAAADVPITLSVLPDVDITLTVENPEGTGGFSGTFVITTLTSPITFSGSTIFATTITNSKRSSPTPYPTIAPTTTPAPAPTASSSTTTAPTSTPTPTFTVTEEVVDFARVAVLFIFQEKTLTDASTAQTSVQKFFSSVADARNRSSAVTPEQATNVTIGGGNTIDFVNFFVDIGTGRKVGGRPS